MSDIVVTVGLERPEHETKLSKAIDAFARWREENLCMSTDAQEELHIMVRTKWDTSGQLSKQLIFPDRMGADAFLKFWQEEQKSLS